ncbi:hypothetical protein F0562_005810 [Nyssa sinensis]|uniref:Uncharacterized protein n=1 Tax=Nyssa sinensis TaxID=561372 RepID=A0A5J5APV9_9ASTE|nr:hypothetical protein F0562_005810 [Nyssa sinensis]
MGSLKCDCWGFVGWLGIDLSNGLAAVIELGRIPGSIVLKYLELEKSPCSVGYFSSEGKDGIQSDCWKQWLETIGLGAMGFGFPATIGCCLDAVRVAGGILIRWDSRVVTAVNQCVGAVSATVKRVA